MFVLINLQYFDRFFYVYFYSQPCKCKICLHIISLEIYFISNAEGNTDIILMLNRDHENSEIFVKDQKQEQSKGT